MQLFTVHNTYVKLHREGNFKEHRTLLFHRMSQLCGLYAVNRFVQ